MTPTEELFQAPYRPEACPPQRMTDERYADLLARGYAPPPQYLRDALDRSPSMRGGTITLSVRAGRSSARITAAGWGGIGSTITTTPEGTERWTCHRGLWKRLA